MARSADGDWQATDISISIRSGAAGRSERHARIGSLSFSRDRVRLWNAGIPGFHTLETGRPESQRTDAGVLGQLRPQWRPQWPGPARVACLSVRKRLAGDVFERSTQGRERRPTGPLSVFECLLGKIAETVCFTSAEVSSLCFLARRYGCRELVRLLSWNAQRVPFSCFHGGEVLGGEQDLPDVMRVVRDLPVDGLHHRVGFGPNCHRAS